MTSTILPDADPPRAAIELPPAAPAPPPASAAPGIEPAQSATPTPGVAAEHAGGPAEAAAIDPVPVALPLLPPGGDGGGPPARSGERRLRGPHGRRRRARGDRPERGAQPGADPDPAAGAYPAASPGNPGGDEAIALGALDGGALAPHAVPAAFQPPPPAEPFAGSGDDLNAAAMPEHAIARELLERGRRAAKQALNAQSEKLHKVLADAGVGSRRDMEELIIAGRVSVNGQPAHTGQRVLPTDQVRINGQPLPRKVPGRLPRVLLYHKPAGEIVSADDPEKRRTVFETLPRIAGSRWVAVGRLDFNTEGLLILTTSGELANRLMHPRHEVEREYAVRVLGELGADARRQLLEGVSLDDGVARVGLVEDSGGQGANHWYRVVLTEGRNREVRRLFDAVGLQVSRLIRVRFGAIQLPRSLARGRWQELAPDWVQAWLHDLGVGAEVLRGGAPPPARSSGPGAAPGRGPGPRRAPGQGQGQQVLAQGQGERRRPAQGNGQGGPSDGALGRGGHAESQAERQRQSFGQGNGSGNGNGQGAAGQRSAYGAGSAGPGRGPGPGQGSGRNRQNKPGKPGKPGTPRQPDPMTSTVNYIVSGRHPGMPGAGAGQRARRFKAPRGVG